MSAITSLQNFRKHVLQDIRSQPIEIFYRLKEPEITVSCPVKRFSDFSAASSSISSPSSISSYSSSDDYVYKSKKRNRRRKKSTKNKTKTFHAQAFCSSDLKLKLKLTQKPLHRKKRRKRSNDTTLDAILKKVSFLFGKSFLQKNNSTYYLINTDRLTSKHFE